MNEASPDTDAIARELAALGEPAPSPTELALVGEAVHDEPEVASVERLAELAEPLDFEALSELESRRVWRRVEQRIEGQLEGQGETRSVGPTPSRWLFAAAGLAAAAALTLLVLPRDDEGEVATGDASVELSAEAIAEQGESVRAALATLDDGRSDTARAQARLASYRARLEQEQGG